MAKKFALSIILEAVDRATRNIQRVNAGIDRLTAKAAKASKRLAVVGRKMTLGLTAPIVGLGVAAVRTASQIEDRFAKVKSLGIRADEMDKLRKATFKTARVIGVPLSQIQEALYDIVSKTASTSDRAGLMRKAAELALSGGGTVKEAVSLITSAVNVYKVKGVEAARVSHAIVAAVQKGGASMAGLAQNFGPQAAVLKGYNIRFDEHLALVGGMTTANVKGAMANTLLGRSVIDLDKGLRKAKLGKLSDLIKKSGGYVAALKAIKTQVGGGDAFRKLFGTDEGFRGAMLMLSTAQASTDAVKLARSNADVHGKALAERNAQTAASWQRLKNTLSILSTHIATLVTPILEKMAKHVGALADRFNKLSPSTKKWVVGIAALLALLGPVVLIVGKLTLALKIVAGAVMLVTNVLSLLRSAIILNPIGVLIAAIAVSALLIYKYWKPISAFFVRIWDAIKAPFVAFWEFVEPVLRRPINLMKKLWGPIGGFFGKLWKGIIKVFRWAWKIISWIVKQVVKAVNAMVNAVKKMARGFGGIGGAMKALSQSQKKQREIAAAAAPEDVPAHLMRGSRIADPATAAAPGGTTKVEVIFRNTPQGTRLNMDKAGADALIRMGYAEGVE